jgi:ABC-type lipoprotein release transport system permease subunit
LDPATFLTVSAVVGVVSLMACYLPARLAAGIEPSELLRME